MPDYVKMLFAQSGHAEIKVEKHETSNVHRQPIFTQTNTHTNLKVSSLKLA